LLYLRFQMETLSDYDYKLPEHLIAKYPLSDRTKAKLLVLDRSSGSIRHHTMGDLPDLLQEGDLLVANRSKVIHARLRGERLQTGGAVECFLVARDKAGLWECLLKAAGSTKEGFSFRVHSAGPELLGRVENVDTQHGTRWVRFSREPDAKDGSLPLPHYLGREVEEQDEVRYQCVYAREPGSVAAPTAGLHLTDALLRQMARKGILFETLVLHVGLGTFRPVKVDKIEDHLMHKESFNLPESVAEAHLKKKGRLIAIGTTSLRALESAWQGESWKTGPQSTSLFLRPGGEPGIRVVEGLLTNFHLPKSSLLMLVSAFAGFQYVRSAYQEAIKKGYRFYSYGDACLIL
jgi:S-adenosylmethionine:tRNA ribosyltransferase-isomerase